VEDKVNKILKKEDSLDNTIHPCLMEAQAIKINTLIWEALWLMGTSEETNFQKNFEVFTETFKVRQFGRSVLMGVSVREGLTRLYNL